MSWPPQNQPPLPHKTPHLKPPQQQQQSHLRPNMSRHPSSPISYFLTSKCHRSSPISYISLQMKLLANHLDSFRMVNKGCFIGLDVVTKQVGVVVSVRNKFNDEEAVEDTDQE